MHPHTKVAWITGIVFFSLIIVIVVLIIFVIQKNRLPSLGNGKSATVKHPKRYPTASIEGIQPASSRDTIEGDYLYAWTGSVEPDAPDFMAVVDARPESKHYGRVISTARIPASKSFPHHMEMSVHNDNKFMANSFMANKNWGFDFRDPARPYALGEAEPLANSGFGFAHSFARLPDGKVIASLQSGPDGQGGLGVFDPQTGKVLKTVSSADPKMPNLKVLTYGVEVVPDRNLVVTSSFNMNMKDPIPPLIQIYDMNSLELLQSFEPKSAIDECSSKPLTDKESQLTFEIRAFKSDKKIGAVINTYNCGYYFLDLTQQPYKLHRGCPIIDDKDGCAVPAMAYGRYLIMPSENDHSLTVLDLHPDPLKPKKVSRFYFDPRYFGHYWPHWVTFDAKRSRVATSDFTDPDKTLPDGTIYLFDFDPKSGKLTIDKNFKSPDSNNPGVRFRKMNKWPHGETGPAVPHGITFSHPRLDCGNEDCCCGMNCKCPPPCNCTKGKCCCSSDEKMAQI